MITSGRILGIMGGVLAALVATLLLGVAIGGPELAGRLGSIVVGAASGVTGRAIFALVGVTLLVGDVTLLLRALGLSASKVIDFKTDSGQMAVDVSALEECLRRTAVEDPDVADAVVRLHVPRGGLDKPIVCDVEIGLRERSDVPGKGKDLAAAIRRRFLQIIPIETDPVVNIGIRIRPPRPDGESGKTTQAMGAAGDEAAEGAAEEALPDVPDFTGERRYSDSDENGNGKADD